MAHDIPSSRAAAIKSGVSHYFTGRPCKHGHFSRRSAPGGDCLECKKLQLRAYRKAEPAVAYATTKRYRQKNPETARISRKRHYESRADHYRQQAALRASRMREVLAAYAAQWRKDNPGRMAAYANQRRCAEIRRTPTWADIDAIEEIYKRCPIGAHVDHYFPLRGKYISGLHVAHNLQYLPAKENLRKGNKFKPTWPLPDFAVDVQRARAGIATLLKRP